MTILEAALDHVRRGFKVFPVFPVRHGECACPRRAACEDAGKHPIGRFAPHGRNDATGDEATIRRWWTDWRDANIGIATGTESGVFVLDVDPRHGGDETLHRLELQHGMLPHSWEAKTGSGGRHVFFQHPGYKTVSRQGRLGPGLDIKGDGGYVVGAGSRNTNGEYVWEVCAHPDDMPLAEAPRWLLNRCRETFRANRLRGGDETDWASLLQGAPEGERHQVGARIAGHFLGRGLPADEVKEILIGFCLRCVPPFCEDEAIRIVDDLARNDEDRARPRSNGAAPANPWTAAEPAPEFLRSQEAELDFIEDRLLARGSITEWFSPRGLGKTLVAHALAVKHARMGRRVLLIDRDNSRREVKRRLRAWGGAEASTFRVMTRDRAPAMIDRVAWAAFPFAEYDIIIVDSIDAATEGVGESDSAKPAKALAPLLDIAHREAGPAILVLGNVIKSGAYGRGSGIIEDRADIVFEVRDATDLTPTGARPWWLELPPAGREAWGERAARRKRRTHYRLAFVPSKFRIGEEPDPFILEADVSQESWRLTDVTAEVEEAGKAAQLAAQQATEATQGAARQGLADEILAAARAGTPWTGGEAETYLTKIRGLPQKAARALIREGEGSHWRSEIDRTRRGHPRLLFPVTADDFWEIAGVTTGESNEKHRQIEGLSSVSRFQSGRRETDAQMPGQNAAISNQALPSSPRFAPRRQSHDEESVAAPAHSEACDCFERVSAGADPSSPEEFSL
jgi:Bifunctional DNA primase/polymerase, N-terminal/AAA domain